MELRLQIFSHIIDNAEAIYYYLDAAVESEVDAKDFRVVTLSRICWNLLQICRQFREDVKTYLGFPTFEALWKAQNRHGNELCVPRRRFQPDLDIIFLESGPVRDETFVRYRVDGSREPLPGPYFRWPDRELLSHYLSALPDPAPEDTNRASFKDSITHIAFPHHSLYEGDIAPSRGPPFDWLRDALPNLQNISVVSGQTWWPHCLFDPDRSVGRRFEPEWDQFESFRDDPRFKDDRRLWKLLRRPELPLCLEPVHPMPQDSRALRRLDQQIHSTWPEEDAEDAEDPA